MTKNRTAIVVGASSGIGAACARELAQRGYRVAALARRQERLEELKSGPGGDAISTYAHDVKDVEAVPDLFAGIVRDLGRLDMIIYATGVMPKIEQDTYDFAKDREVLDTNLLGCVRWLNEAAPFMQKQGSGSIVGISSIAGDRGRVGYPVYNTSKAAMNTYLEALRNRLTRHGVRVTTIKPGYVATSMTEGMKGLFWVAQPEQAAKAIVSAAEKGRQTRYVLRRWGLVGMVIRNIPSFIFRKLDI